MTEQQTPDREKKIAEIREAAKKSWWNIFDDARSIANAPEWLRFLLTELDRIEREYAEERAAHNAHVTELCELEKENRKLREERDDLIDGLLVYAEQRIGSDDDGEHARNILREIGVTVE